MTMRSLPVIRSSSKGLAAVITKMVFGLAGSLMLFATAIRLEAATAGKRPNVLFILKDRTRARNSGKCE